MNNTSDDRRKVEDQDRERIDQGLKQDCKGRNADTVPDVELRRIDLSWRDRPRHTHRNPSGIAPAQGSSRASRYPLRVEVVADGDTQPAAIQGCDILNSEQYDISRGVDRRGSGSISPSRNSSWVRRDGDRAGSAALQGAGADSRGSIGTVTRLTKVVRGVPIHIELTDIAKDKNFRNPTPIIKFTVNIHIDDMHLLAIPGFMLIDGRIQVPFKTVRTAEGELKAKVVKPLFPFLSLVHECIEQSDWWHEWPNLSPLVPVVRRQQNEDEQFNRE